MKELALLWADGAPLTEGTGDEDSPAITPYLVDGKGNSAVIVCPGGGYGLRANHEGEPVAKWLNSLGISAFVLRYRVAPYRYPCALLDAQRTIRTVRHQAASLGVSPDRIGILGFSAGGHLASTAGTNYDAGNTDAGDPIERESCRPDFMVLCYPVITMKGPHVNVGSCNNLLGSDPDSALIELMSSETRITSDTPPTFLWSTSDDTAVPVENSFMFATELKRHGVPFDLHVYARGKHGLGLAESVDHVKHWTSACESWLRYNGYAK
jgi:acetyl esterase/lipase